MKRFRSASKLFNSLNDHQQIAKCLIFAILKKGRNYPSFVNFIVCPSSLYTFGVKDMKSEQIVVIFGRVGRNVMDFLLSSIYAHSCQQHWNKNLAIPTDFGFYLVSKKTSSMFRVPSLPSSLAHVRFSPRMCKNRTILMWRPFFVASQPVLWSPKWTKKR